MLGSGNMKSALISYLTETEGGRTIIIAIILLMLTLAIYSSSLDTQWHFDDYQNIVENERVHLGDLSWTQLKNSFYSPYSGKISRPLAFLSFALNYYFSGLKVFSYHVVNLIIHFLTSFFLFLFVYNTLKLPSIPKDCQTHAFTLAALSATFWMVNPLHISSITYIVQRMASMAALFYLMAMFFYLQARTEKRRIRKFIYFMAVSTSAVAAIGSKENALMLPLSLFLYELLLLQKMISKENLFKYGLYGIAMLVILFVSSIPLVDYSTILGGYVNRPFNLTQRLLTEPRVIVYYVTLLLYPTGTRLTLIHDFDISYSLFDPWTTWAAILLIGIAFKYALNIAKKQALISFCMLFFLMNHIIEGTFLPLEIIYEHRNYLPSLFFFVPISIGIVTIDTHLREKSGRTGLWAFVAGVLIIQCVTVFLQNRIWENEITLWADNVRKAPAMHRPRHNLGVSLMAAGYVDEGRRELELALLGKNEATLNQKYTTHYHLGRYYFLNKDYETAARHFQQTLYWAPLYPEPYHYMAKLMCIKGDLKNADLFVKKALSLKNDDNFLITYGLIKLQAGDMTEAQGAAKRVLSRHLNHGRAHALLARIYHGRNENRLATMHDQAANGTTVSCAQLK